MSQLEVAVGGGGRASGSGRADASKGRVVGGAPSAASAGKAAATGGGEGSRSCLGSTPISARRVWESTAQVSERLDALACTLDQQRGEEEFAGDEAILVHVVAVANRAAADLSRNVHDSLHGGRQGERWGI